MGPKARPISTGARGVLSVPRLLDQLDSVLRSDVLVGAVDWALGLCTPREGRVLMQLAVLADGFDLPCAEAVVEVADAGETWPPNVLQALVSASLIYRRSAHGTVGLALYEPVRRQALRALHAEPAVADAARSRRLAYTMSVCEALLAQVDGGHAAERARVALFRSDVVADFEAFRSQDPEGAARLVLAVVRGSREVYRPGSAVRQLLDRLSAASDALPAGSAVAVRAERSRVPRDDARRLEALRNLMVTAHKRGHRDEAVAFGTQALARVEAAGDVWRCAAVRDTLAMVIADEGDLGEAFVLAHLGQIELAMGRPTEAESLLDDALALLDDPWTRRWQSRVQAARAWARVRLSRPRAASADATDATQPVPGLIEVMPWVALAVACHVRGRMADAHEALARVRELGRDHPDPRVIDRVAMAEARVTDAPDHRLLSARCFVVRAVAGWV